MIHGSLRLAIGPSTGSFPAFLMTKPIPPTVVPMQIRPRAGSMLHRHLREQPPELDGNAGLDEARCAQAASRA